MMGDTENSYIDAAHPSRGMGAAFRGNVGVCDQRLTLRQVDKTANIEANTMGCSDAMTQFGIDCLPKTCE